MTTVVEGTAQRRMTAPFYMGMALTAAVTAFVGFAPTFYLRGHLTLRPDQPALSPLLVTHGLVGTAWIVLFLVQTLLVASRRIRLHRRLGILGATVAAVFVVVGTLTAIDALRRGVGPFGLDPRIWFLSVPLAGIVLFAVLVQRRSFSGNDAKYTSGSCCWLRSPC
jgi:hypothetical protein